MIQQVYTTYKYKYYYFMYKANKQAAANLGSPSRDPSLVGPAAQKKPWLLYSKNTALVNLDHNYDTHTYILMINT